jgi:carboxypeptidase C (cathepsin A)
MTVVACPLPSNRCTPKESRVKELFRACLVIFISIGVSGLTAMAQSSQSAETTAAKPPAEVTKEESSVTDHTIRVGGQEIAYQATAGTFILKDDKGDPTASLFYIAYTRKNAGDLSKRPLAFLYNGGPGSSSVWMHLGAFGPKRVATSDAQPTPPSPYRLNDNPYSLLDVADLVFLDPVGTGYSHAVGKSTDKDFWGIDQDVRSLAQAIRLYVTRNGRWDSPKFLIGESYGTFRSAALGNYLQNSENMDLNGIILLSSVLDLGTISFNAGDDRPYILYLPSYAAAGWYHKVIQDRPADLNTYLTEVRRFASGEYASALIKGSKLSDAEKADIAKRVARYTGLPEDYVLKANLRIRPDQFMKELLRGKGLVAGRYDSRFTGDSPSPLGESADYDPSYSAVAGAFTALLNAYLRDELNVKQDRSYTILTGLAGAWDWKRQGFSFGFPGSPNVEDDLASAIVLNPYLKVQIEIGLYDMATPFFEVENTIEHLDLPDKLRGNIEPEYYEAGHMMYLHDPDLAKLKNNVAGFIESASKRE